MFVSFSCCRLQAQRLQAAQLPGYGFCLLDCQSGLKALKDPAIPASATHPQRNVCRHVLQQAKAAPCTLQPIKALPRPSAAQLRAWCIWGYFAKQLESSYSLCSAPSSASFCSSSSFCPEFDSQPCHAVCQLCHVVPPGRIVGKFSPGLEHDDCAAAASSSSSSMIVTAMLKQQILLASMVMPEAAQNC